VEEEEEERENDDDDKDFDNKASGGSLFLVGTAARAARVCAALPARASAGAPSRGRDSAKAFCTRM